MIGKYVDTYCSLTFLNWEIIKNWDNIKDLKISMYVSNIIMLQKYSGNDEYQSQVSENEILKLESIKSVGHLGCYTKKFTTYISSLG
jgi:hypothetical protein